MSITLARTYSAISGGNTSSFLANGGTGPYTYSVTMGGAGGSVDSSTGIYTAPALPNSDPALAYDTIVATDTLAATGSANILVGNPYQLFCNIIEVGMGLANGRVYLWDQKIMQPTDSGLYAAVSVVRQRNFTSNGKFNSDGEFVQYTNLEATMGIDVISRSALARDLKEQVLMTLYSQYAEQQMEKNCFFIGRIPNGSNFINLSAADGAAIPYRFHIDINMQFFVKNIAAVSYFSSFQQPSVVVNP